MEIISINWIVFITWAKSGYARNQSETHYSSLIIYHQSSSQARPIALPWLPVTDD